MTEDPLVSVIIPVRDDPAGIRQVLACLSEQTLASHQFEIIIGDDGSRSDAGCSRLIYVAVDFPQLSSLQHVDEDVPDNR